MARHVDDLQARMSTLDFASAFEDEEAISTGWQKLAGGNMKFKVIAKGEILIKTTCQREIMAYGRLKRDRKSKCLPLYVPRFYETSTTEDGLAMSNLLSPYRDPSIVAVKLGRSFLESDLEDGAPIPSFYDQIVKFDESAVSQKERRVRAVTTGRYLQFLDGYTTTSVLGFRIEAYTNLYGSRSEVMTCDVDHARSIFASFMPKGMYNTLLVRLLSLRQAFKRSEFLARHEIVGSTLLIAFDRRKVGAWLIDFEKALEIPEGEVAEHYNRWEEGTHSDCFLKGLDNLLAMLGDIANELYS